jgi:CRP/FNR family transcriptional regulator, cyclic AMP receptor protein
MQLKELFERIDFFSGLEDKILRKLAEAAVTRQYGKDEVIVRQGEMGLGLYIIVRGRVKVEREQAAGPPIKVAELAAEQFFAEMSIVDNKPRSATVTTMEDTECLLLTRDSFVNLMQKFPEIPIRVARLLAERLRAADERLAAEPPKAAPGGAPTNGAQPAAEDGTAAAPATPEEGAQGAKEKVQSSLLNAFQNLYTMKAFTRFSVAVLGCPVEGSAANLVDEIRVGEVKALVLPAGEAVHMRITAREPGSFTLHVFVPGAERPVCFGPLDVRPEDDVALLLDKGEVGLQYRP